MGLGILCGFLAALLSWQINLVALHRGLHHHAPSAFWVGVGSAAADVLILLAVLGGAGPLFDEPYFYAPARLLGAACIAATGLRILFHRAAPGSKPEPAGHRDFLTGFALVAGNPAIYVMWIGAVGFLAAHLPALQHWSFRLLFLAGFLAGACAWSAILAGWLLDAVRKSGEGSLHVISRVSAMALLAAAALLFFHKF